MKREASLILNRIHHNKEALIKKLVSYLARHVVQVENKIEHDKFLLSSSLSYYTAMLDSYYLHFMTIPTSYPDELDNVNDHLKEIISFLSFEDEELKITLLPGHTHIPPHIAANITIPDSFYRDDEKIFNTPYDKEKIS